MKIQQNIVNNKLILAGKMITFEPLTEIEVILGSAYYIKY